MNALSTRSFAYLIIGAALCFASGVWIGRVSMQPDDTPTSVVFTTSNALSVTPQKDNQTDSQLSNTASSKQSSVNVDSDLSSESTLSKDEIPTDQISEDDFPDNIEEKLALLKKLFEQNADYDLTGALISDIRNTIEANPALLDELLEQFNALPDGRERNQQLNFLLSIVQGIEDDIGLGFIVNAAESRSNHTTEEEARAFMALVSRTNFRHASDTLTRSLIDIGLYSDYPLDVRLHALDLMMPFQVPDSERQAIVDQLTTRLEDTATSDYPQVIPHMIRFSDNAAKERLATEFLNNTQSQSVRLTIIDSIHSQMIPKSTEIKNELMKIARNSEDPLQERALHTLMFAFDISNEEYTELVNKP